MLQSYDDILNMLTLRIRREHYYHYLYMDEGHEGAAPDCKSFSYDLIGKPDEISKDGQRCCSCVAKPGWYDENGTPRFARHHPSLCPDIYADEVCLLVISCQACGHEYRVQMSWGLSGVILRTLLSVTAVGGASPTPEAMHEKMRETSLAVRIQNGSVHFGDPPCFHDNCTSGATMNCWDLRVLEFWRRDRRATHDWVRVSELEIELPDATDPERTAEARQ